MAQDAPPPEGGLPPPKVAPKVDAQVAVAKPAEVEDPTTDHEKVVGHFGVGYLGLASLPIAPGGGIPSTVDAPVIGMRYWLSEKLGLDLGLGFALTSGSTESVRGPVTTSVDKASVWGFAIHGGVPLVFAHQKHFSFLLVPELNLGFAGATEKPTAPNAPEISHSGLHLDVGARIGGEIQFGFIGIPQLALQATVGAYVRHDQRKASADANGVTNSDSSSDNTFGTSVQSDPWALFTNNISAIYYLP